MLSAIQQNKLKITIEECDKHLSWMTSAHNKISSLFPLSSENYNNLDPDNVPLIDQYLYRFTKLQYSMGSRLFPLILNIIAEDVKSMSFIDILNRLEQLNIIDSKDTWLELRNLRNRAAHEYDDVENIDILNILFKNKDILENIYEKSKLYILNK